MKVLRFLVAMIVFSVVPALLQVPHSAAQENQGTLSATAKAIEADKALVGRLDACPVDYFAKAAAPDEPLMAKKQPPVKELLVTCKKDPASCLAACGKSGGARHCFSLAITFERAGPTVHARSASILFAAACARGLPGGCTNRAAKIVNNKEKSDPWASETQGKRNLCSYRSVKLACDKNDPWGCTMVAMSHALGRGAKQDRLKAEIAVEKACQLAPGFQACKYGKNVLKAHFPG